MQKLTPFLGIGAAIFLSACSSITTDAGADQKAGALPEARIMKSALAREQIRSRILTLGYMEGGRKIGRSVVLFCYGNTMAAWDSQWGSIPIGSTADFQSNSSSRLGSLYLNGRFSTRRPSLLSAALVDDRTPRGNYGGQAAAPQAARRR